jgi:hypothetical protein
MTGSFAPIVAVRAAGRTFPKPAIARIGHSRGRPIALGFNRCGRDHTPLRVGQVGLVSGGDAAMLLSSSWRPHGVSKIAKNSPESRTVS